MIQRIQTLYLFIVSALSGLMLLLPLGRFIDKNTADEFVLRAFEIATSHSQAAAEGVSTWYMGILIVMAALLPLVTIFLFRNRMLQVRLCFMGMVFQVGIIGFICFYYYHITNVLEAAYSFAIADVFPVVNIILCWMAFRAIMKDELLVRSVNRIR